MPRINRARNRAILMALLTLSGASGGWAASAPPQLYGKTIHVLWTSSVVRRPSSEQVFAHTEHTRHLVIYVSSAGRPFIRFWTARHNGASAVNEQVGASGQNSAGGSQTAEFQGRSLVVTSGYQGGAARYQMDFDASFGACSATIIFGKESGANTYLRRGANGRLVEVQSESAGTPSCSVEEGNPFAR